MKSSEWKSWSITYWCHCVKSVQIRSFLWSVFSCTDQKKLRIWTLFTQCAVSSGLKGTKRPILQIKRWCLIELDDSISFNFKKFIYLDLIANSLSVNSEVVSWACGIAVVSQSVFFYLNIQLRRLLPESDSPNNCFKILAK